MTNNSGGTCRLIRRKWFFCCYYNCKKMFQVRTIRQILVNTGLFVLGILTTLIVIANREEPIDLCDLGSLSSSSSSSSVVDGGGGGGGGGNAHSLNPPVFQQSPSHSFLREPPNRRNNFNNNNVDASNQIENQNVAVASHNQNVGGGGGVVPGTAPGQLNMNDLVVGGEDSEASVNVNNLLLPFSSTVVKRNLIYVITPTYNRPEQIPELTRLAQTLLHVNRIIHWVVVEDVDRQTVGLDRFLNRFHLNYSLLKSVKPKVFNKVVGKPRGVGGRRAALEWLRFHKIKGIVYFADDDNTYDIEIFHQIQKTKKVSMWPVGLVTDFGVSSPIVRDAKVIGFYDGWRAYRKFPVDMAGFAINLKLIHAKKNANMPWVAGYEEDEILRSLGVNLNDIQPLAHNCTEILVWHTKSVKYNWSKKAINLKPGLEASTNLNTLLKKLPQPSTKNNNGDNNNNNNLSSGPQEKRGSDHSNGFSFMHFIFGNNFR